VDAVHLSWNKKTIDDNNCHTANGDEIHSVQFCEGTGTVKVTREPSTCTSQDMLNLKEPKIHNIKVIYVQVTDFVLNEELCN